MFRRYLLFVRGLATNWVGLAGVVLTTSAFLFFLLMEALRMTGAVTNAYVGLLTYMALPGLFILGLLLVPLGWWRFRRVTGRRMADLMADRFPREMLRGGTLFTRIGRLILVLTLVNLLFLGAGGARMLRFMDSPVFCGTACHQVMHPEWITYQDSPHARVKCVECHVGEGAGAQLDAKLNGLWQIVSATFDLHERPIPTPVHNLRPARETCEKCHWPEKFYGDRIKVFPTFGEDRESTPSWSALALKVGSGGKDQSGTIHWHIAQANRVDYQSLDEDRLQMLWVKVRRPGGGFHTYRNRRLAGRRSPRPPRTLDCVDCHNRATHIYERPGQALDDRLARGELDRSLPFVKRVAAKALRREYGSTREAMAGIERTIRGFYARLEGSGGAGLADRVTRTIGTVQAAWRRNIHPRMAVGWGVYPDHRGHRTGPGCFRCHNADLVDEEGRAIAHDCTLCHSILSFRSPRVFQYLGETREGDPEAVMHRYLRAEFMENR